MNNNNNNNNNPSDDLPTDKVRSNPSAGSDNKRGQQQLRLRNILIVALAFTSGFIDAISFLGLAVFASVMTGNTVLLGLAIGTGNVPLGLGALVALMGYIGGVVLGVRIVDPRTVLQKGWPDSVTRAFVIEALVLSMLAIGGFFAGSEPSILVLYTFVVFASTAMGIQSAAVNALGISGISTTYITGTWTSLIGSLARRRRQTTSKNKDKEEIHTTRLQAVVVVAYVVAAVAGGISEINWSLKAAIIPVITVSIVIAVARTRM
jgi:uncharacterized membrane protein YoaK (UPF0700 family)